MIRILSRPLFHFSTNYPGFKRISSFKSQELKVTVDQLQHEHTGSRVYHFANEDPVNAFASVIRTFVKNDKGCPHILEHLACCGSQKFPIRDPFFNMLKRSVSTYMNAWTGEDFTAYPFASANRKDWSNLYSIYLDMSMKPLLNELDFAQEGWRYELDESGNRVLKGIVLNEMRAAYQESDRLMHKEMSATLFRGTPYEFDSGGHPKDIVNLPYSELLEMYRHYYHPSNMSFYFYGNQPIAGHLKTLHEQYLMTYADERDKHTPLVLQPRPLEHHHKIITTPSSDDIVISVCYYLGNHDRFLPAEVMAIKIISYALLTNNNSLAYQQFIQSGIASTFGSCGINENKLLTYLLTLKGISQDYTCQQFQAAVNNLLRTVIQQGVAEGKIEEFLHQFEIGNITARQNNGIKFLEEFIYLMNHKADLQGHLNLTRNIETAKHLLRDKEQLAALIERCFLKNEQYLVTKRVPAKEEEKQGEPVSNIQIQDSAIKDTQERLAARQKEPQNVQVLPTLKIQDLVSPNRKEPVLRCTQEKNGKSYSKYHLQINEDVHFYRLYFKFGNPSKELLRGLTLWAYNINKGIATGLYGFKELSSKLNLCCSNFNIHNSIGEDNSMYVVFEAACLKRNIAAYFHLLSEILLNPRFEKDNTLSISKSFLNEMREELTESPMGLCIDACGSSVSHLAAIFDSFERTKEGMAMAKLATPEPLYLMSLEILQADSIILIEHSNSPTQDVPSFVQPILLLPPKKQPTKLFVPNFRSRAVTHNYNVNFCSQQYLGPEYLSSEHAHLSLMLEILEQDYLHPRIREQGGAYGAGCNLRDNGLIALYSYADPNSNKTFQTFNQSVEEFIDLKSIQEEKIKEVRMKIIGEIDRVKVPQDEGISFVTRNVTIPKINGFRDIVKTASVQAMLQSARKYLSAEKSRMVFGKEVPQHFAVETIEEHL